MHPVNKKKIINDPIYGFVSIEDGLVFDLVQHPYFQRLRRIKQLGLTNLVYPGANHTRFHHALGAMHLMGKAIKVLQSKGIEITKEEETSALIAILLHDIGHGPFSHVMEHAFIEGIAHEEVSLAFMKKLNVEFKGQLTIAIEIFTNTYKKKFLHQLVSSQLDVDRLDYLTRDSFYTGVSEGIVGLERIIQMLNVENDQLVIDEKGIYSVEKFIVARRLMYWQVYLHKTTIGADCILQNALKRAKHLRMDGQQLFSTPSLDYFLQNKVTGDNVRESTEVLHLFSQLDDLDIITCLKAWQHHDDRVLAFLSDSLINRNLPKITIQNEEIPLDYWQNTINEVREKFDMSSSEAEYMVTIGKLHNSAYHSSKEEIVIRKKDGQLIDLAQASQNYNFVSANSVATKYFVCRPK
ncbi:MAG: HD domain-containing protein [Bacteroidia bacterium]|nr:HD domain-containing protein [Bacteroidia bacterium]